jgi:RNA polymerase sigma factor (sigma-70 family)
VDEQDFLARRFEAHRGHLRAVAYRMLGSLSEADDALQEAWLKVSRTDTGQVENLAGWLTTVVGRVCLDMLRSRTARREEPLDAHLPDPIVSNPDTMDPEDEVLLADSVGLALLVVLESLRPAERLAFVLHDMFAVPFDDIGPILGRSPAAAKQLASRARRRVRETAVPDPDLSRQREVVDAFLAASRGGDFDALVALLAPDVVARSDSGTARPGAVVRGAAAVARQVLSGVRSAHATVVARPALVNGAVGVIGTVDGRPVSVLAFTITGGRIVEIDIFSGRDRLRDLGLTALD